MGLLSDYFFSWVWWARSIGFDANPCKFCGFFEGNPVCFSLAWIYAVLDRPPVGREGWDWGYDEIVCFFWSSNLIPLTALY